MTTQQKHTPGPWMQENSNIVALTYGWEGAEICRLTSLDRYTGRTLNNELEVTTANAHLIASAPDLLEVCKEAEATLGENLQWLADKFDLEIRHGDKDALRRLKRFNETWVGVVKAIAKAKGEL